MAALTVGLWVALHVSSPGRRLTEAEFVERFGATAGHPVDSGIVFINGYVDAPYTVSRHGSRITINGVAVSKCAVPPLPKWVPSRDPGLPRGLSEKSTWADYCGTRHGWRKYHYAYANYPPHIAMEKLTEYYRQLPFVEGVTPQRSGDPAYLVVKMKNGHVRNVDISPPHGSPSVARVVVRLERERQCLEELLQWGKVGIPFDQVATIYCGASDLERA